MTNKPLSGLRIVEVSSFVAAPLCGLTLAQLGADVIRVDPIGGGADRNRWPITDSGESIYWTGLNRGKRSITCDMRTPDGRELVQQLVVAAGILVTNSGGRAWLSHDVLSALRPDVITLEVLGRRDGSAAVDYTVNAATGFPSITGPLLHHAPVNHVLPAWDVACGLYAALAVTAAVRKRELTGEGTAMTLPLEDVALATAGNLGYLTEVQINMTGREATGNAVYGTYGNDFTTADGARFMIVALTPRHVHDLIEVTGTAHAVAALESALVADFTKDGDRYRHRDVLTALFATWFREHTADEVATALAETSVLHEHYRDFVELVKSGELEANPMFAPLEQPRIGTFLATGLPAAFDGHHLTAGSAPAIGANSADVIRDLLDSPQQEVDDLVDHRIIGAS